MTGWKETSLSEIIQLIGGGTPKTSVPEYWNGEIPWLSVVDFNTGKKYVFDAEKKITQSGLINSSTKLLNKGDIIISARGTVGAIAVLAKQMTFNQSCYGIRAIEEKSITDFVYYLLKDTVANLIQISHGGVFDTITKDTFKEINVPLPPLPEQKAIALVLSSLDDKIDLLTRQNATLEAVAETLFRQWFVEEAQEDWEEVKVDDFVEINNASISKEYTHRIIKYLDTGSLTEGKIESYQSYDLDQAPSRAKRIAKHNDVLISTVRPNQKHYGIIKNPTDDLIVSTGFCVLTCSKIDPHFIYLLLTTNEMTEYLHSVAEGSTSTYPSLKPSDIGTIRFQLPPKEKLESFAKLATVSWSKIENNHIQIHTLEKLRDNLLPKLMSGEVRVAV